MVHGDCGPCDAGMLTLTLFSGRRSLNLEGRRNGGRWGSRRDGMGHAEYGWR